MAYKKKLYEELMERQVAACEKSYFYESCWFAHAIFEDRFRSIVKYSGDGTRYGRKIAEKIEIILERHDATVAKVVGGRPARDKKSGKKKKVPKWPFLHTLDRGLVEEISNWTKERNDLAHDLADGNGTLFDSDMKCKALAESGISLVKSLCAAARRVKKHSPLKGS